MQGFALCLRWLQMSLSVGLIVLGKLLHAAGDIGWGQGGSDTRGLMRGAQRLWWGPA